jgi:NAD(P)-dependent dehydrogenase (short-subunit alcohol dehydrogenase family)
MNVEGLRGQTIVVTGAASGIGAASARLLVEAGASVVALDLREPAFAVAGFIAVDMADAAAIDAAAAKLPAAVDGLCNIAGVPGNRGVDATMRINVLGLRHLTEALLPRMTKGASIVNLASVAGNLWPERLAAHLALARTAGFDEGLGLGRGRKHPRRRRAHRLACHRAGGIMSRHGTDLPQGRRDPMFIRNAWYVAAMAQEIAPGKLLARTLLGDRIVLFRDAQGRVAALEQAEQVGSSSETATPRETSHA